jgi:hypothetical protein
MAGRSVHIADYGAAFTGEDIPGAFDARRRVYTFPPVETRGARGARLVWQIHVRLETADGAPAAFTDAVLRPGAAAPGRVGVIATESHQVSAATGRRGKTRAGAKPTRVARGKNLGRANATNPATQALRDALGRYNARLRKAGEAPAAADAGDAAAPSQPPPMLVKREGETRAATLGPADFAAGVTVQRKLNGVRLVAHLGADGGVRLYSRTRRAFPGLDRIRAALAAPLRAARPGAHLDGEVYVHGQSLAWISGRARGTAAAEPPLEFHVFDCFFPGEIAAGRGLTGAQRQAYLDELFGRAPPAGLRRVENFAAASMADVLRLRDRFLAEGYEGAIARKNDAAYQYGVNNYHSANLVKLKPLYDAEYPVVGYAQGKRGKDVGAVIWICEVPAAQAVTADRRFSVAPKGMTYPERYRVYRCLGEDVGGGVTRFARDFEGAPLTVEYPELSAKTGKPTQAKALDFRARDDPLRRLMRECGARA